MIEEHLTKLLKAALKDRNWSQQDGANAAGIHIRTLKFILAGTTSPKLTTLVGIAKGWQYESLFDDIGEYLN